MPVTLSALVHAREFYVHSTGGLARHGADVMSCEAIIANHHDVSPVMISVQTLWERELWPLCRRPQEGAYTRCRPRLHTPGEPARRVAGAFFVPSSSTQPRVYLCSTWLFRPVLYVGFQGEQPPPDIRP